MRVKIFTSSPNLELDHYGRLVVDSDFVIATDRQALNLALEEIKVDLAIGDFDSVNEEELYKIKKHAKGIMALPKVKDQTDTEAALEYAKTLNPSEIIIYSKATGRFDHFFSMLSLLESNVVIANKKNKLYMLTPGTHSINPVHRYVSFFAIEDVDNLTLEGLLYPLEAYNLKIGDPLCTSNEGSGKCTFTRGKLLVIESSDE